MAVNINVSMRYSTHLPMLLEAMARTKGDVLELGAGVFSTPVLHWLCEKQKRNLLTIDNSRGWFNFTRLYMRTDYHKFIHVKNWDQAQKHINKEWDVVLVDHSPSERRIVEIRFLANLAKYIICHDSEHWKDKVYHYSQIYPLFKYRFNFTPVDHQTVVLSNFFPLNDFWQPKATSLPSKDVVMKNLMIYINPIDKKFSDEHEILTKIQIDNSLDLGWQPSDILLITNFDYEYQGIKSIKVKDYSVFDQNRSTKIPAINQLFRDGVIKDNELYWFHDHDAFQLVPFQVDLEKDAGFTDHGAWSKTWNAGSFFFKKSASDIFSWIEEYMKLLDSSEQNALTHMWLNNINGINNRYQLMNNTYNIGIYRIDQNVSKSELPIKVAHFHPRKKRHLNLFKDKKILPERLLTIFKKYGIE